MRCNGSHARACHGPALTALGREWLLAWWLRTSLPKFNAMSESLGVWQQMAGSFFFWS